MSPQEAAEVLNRYAVALELTGADEFRARTFANAARQLESETEPLEQLIAEDRLSQIRGVGKAVEAALREVSDTGSFTALEETEKQIPSGVFELLRVQGLGVKKARVLWQQAKITSLNELETALRGNLLPPLPGIGAKTFDKFLQGIEFLRRMEGRYHRHTATREKLVLRDAIAKIPGVRSAYLGGSFRRGCELVGDLDIILEVDGSALNSVRKRLRFIQEIAWSRSDSEPWQGKTIEGMPVELSVVPRESVCARLLLMTGSKAHYQALSQLAQKKKFRITPDSLIDPSGQPVPLRTEADIYRALGLEPVPPALRETAETLIPAGRRSFPRPVALRDFRGILHNHSTYSDGLNTIRELAAAMMAMGYDWVGIADHSQAAQYARGLTASRVKDQWAEIDKLNKELRPFRILKGTEVDIAPDGRLDFDDQLLAGFDYVVASIHSKFQMTGDEATERLCRALENPHVDILGHPTGRLLLQREGYPVDHDRVIRCAADHGKAIELNCHPYRLDLDWRWLARCEELGVPVPINPDAHSIPELNYIRYGIQVAAKGPLTAPNCPSTWTASELLDWCQTRKKPPT